MSVVTFFVSNDGVCILKKEKKLWYIGTFNKFAAALFWLAQQFVHFRHL